MIPSRPTDRPVSFCVTLHRGEVLGRRHAAKRGEWGFSVTLRPVRHVLAPESIRNTSNRHPKWISRRNSMFPDRFQTISEWIFDSSDRILGPPRSVKKSKKSIFPKHHQMSPNVSKRRQTHRNVVFESHLPSKWRQ